MRLNSSNWKSVHSSMRVNFARPITGGSPWADGYCSFLNCYLEIHGKFFWTAVDTHWQLLLWHGTFISFQLDHERAWSCRYVQELLFGAFLTNLFVRLIAPHKEDVDLLEWVQGRATKMIRGLGHLSCESRLKELGWLIGEEQAPGRP